MRLRIKEVLKAAGITSKELAARLGVSPVWMSQIYNGNPTLSRLEEIAVALGVRVSDLLDESGTETATALAGVRCPHCGKVLFLCTSPEELRQTQTPAEKHKQI